MKDLLLSVDVVVKTLNLEISRCHLVDYVHEFYLSACRTCSTIIFPHSTNHIIVFWRRRCRCRRPCLSSLTSLPLPTPPPTQKKGYKRQSICLCWKVCHCAKNQQQQRHEQNNNNNKKRFSEKPKQIRPYSRMKKCKESKTLPAHNLTTHSMNSWYKSFMK